MGVTGWFYETAIGIVGIAVMVIGVRLGSKKEGALGHIISTIGVLIGVAVLLYAVQPEIFENILGMGLNASS